MPIREFDDVDTLRQSIFDRVHSAVQKRYPIENERYRLEVGGLKWDREDPFSLQEQKDAIMHRASLARKLMGEWRLVDKATETVLDKKSSVVAHVPYLTQRGTYIHEGTEYTLANQLRMRPGVYTRRKESGELEAHFNIIHKKNQPGRSFRVYMEPKTGIFKLNVGQANIPMYPVMRGLGVQDADMQAQWGTDLLNANRKDDPQALAKFHQRMIGREAPPERHSEDMLDAMSKFEMDPDVMDRHLGKWTNPTGAKQAAAGFGPHTMMAASRKLIDINKGEAEVDDRDALPNQTIHTPDDFFAERIERDAGDISKRILWNSTNKGKLSGVYSGVLSPQLTGVLLNSGMGQPVEEINPMEMTDQMFRVLRLGEGAISSADAIPDEARNVQPSYFGFLDAFRGPESEKLGVDLRTTFDTYRGDDQQLYSNMIDVRTGKTLLVSGGVAAGKIIAFPGEMKKGTKTVRAMANGRMAYVRAADVDYELPHASSMLNLNVNLIPMPNATQGNRLLMAGKMINQALPIRGAESPLVQAETPVSGVSFEQLAGRKVGAVHSQQPGMVTLVTKDKIVVRHKDGTSKEYELHNNFPMNRKTFIHNTSMVRAGDKVGADQILAKSNFTTDQGHLALGRNLRVAFMPYKGFTYEDGYAISESAAKKLTSEHMYTPELEFDPDTKQGYNTYISKFPTKFNKAQLSTLDTDGAAKPGTIIRKGDPLVLALGTVPHKAEGQWTSIARRAEKAVRDKTVIWEHDFDGEVTDVAKTKSGIQLAVRAYVPMQEGDKMAGRYGDKGVVAKIIADEQMPKDANGLPYDVLQNPLTLPSRLNPAQIFEMQLAKIARKTGKPIHMPQFYEGNLGQHVQDQLRLHGIKDTEHLNDPETGRTIKDVMTGEKFFMKLHHTSEAKWGARETGGYSAEGLPSSGGKEGSKTIGNLAMNALLSHGATDVLRDVKVVRGQRNDDYWRAYKMGYAPPSPEVPLVYRKYMAYLRGAGINLRKDGNRTHLLALTDKDVMEMSKGAINSPDTVRADDLQPIEGGLFDRGLTGGHGGGNWTHIELAEPIPNPIMEEPIRQLLGLTKAEFNDTVAGKVPYNGHTGGAAIREQLARIKVDDAIAAAQVDVRGLAGTKRDAAIKRLRHLDTMKRTGLSPVDLMITKVPVLPPNFRPISQMRQGMQVSADANYLYQDLLHATSALQGVSKEFGADKTGEERLNVYKAAKAVTGLGDPIQPKLVEQNVGGLLKHVFGKGSPKFGMYQRRVIGSRVDTAGRGVITPNPDLDMDQVGLPEDQAWVSYKPFVMRRLVRTGVPATEAAKMIENRDQRAKDQLLEEMDKRPIIVTRAPTLHRYGIMAARPVIVKGKTLQISPTVVSGFNADFDGDTMSYHVPVSDDAVQNAYDKMLPSKNLRSVAQFDIHYAPRHEYQLGLYQASTKKGDGKVHRFLTTKDAIDAYRKGLIGVGDEVVVGDRK